MLNQVVSQLLTLAVATRFMKELCSLTLWLMLPLIAYGQINTDRVMLMGRNALYYEDYVLSIQRFNMVINARPYLSEPYFFRALAKFYLEDYSGAEADCSKSLELNPYVSNTYQLRALCRINRKDYDGAIADYEKVLDQEPKNQSCWHNLVLCRFELKQYDKAIETIDRMIRLWPRDAENYTMKAQASIQQADTVRGLELIDSALVCDAFDTRAWSMRSMISLSRGQYAEAEAEVDKAIVQSPRVAGYYVNRALARFHQNNLRGAMADYDLALEIEPRNYLAHFNRALLRAQVGEDNRAIEDLDYVLSVEPDNMIALFNRALMLDNTGDYRGAIRDITAVIDEYPEFWTGYAQRAAIRRKIGDIYGAERDEFKLLKARMDRRSGQKNSRHKTRKQSSRNIEDYASLVEADSSEPEPEYTSAYRGKVQNRQVELTPQPFYVLSFHHSGNGVSRYMPYYKAVETLNASHILPRAVYLTNHEPTLSEPQMQAHFDAITDATQRIETAVTGQQDKAQLVILYFGRALDEYQVRDFDSAARDLDSAAQLNADNVLVQMLMAQVRQRQMEVQTSEAEGASLTTRLGASAAIDALQRLTSLAPDMPYAWYNLGNLYLSQKDYGKARDAYTRALNADPRFPDAYYNRGLAAILDGNLQSGLADLSQAGEYGLYQAYNLIKRYSKTTAK